MQLVVSAIPVAPISQLANDEVLAGGPLSPLCDIRQSSFPLAFHTTTIL